MFLRYQNQMIALNLLAIAIVLGSMIYQGRAEIIDTANQLRAVACQ